MTNKQTLEARIKAGGGEGWSEYQQRLMDAGCIIHPVGSRTIKGAAGLESDYDYLVRPVKPSSGPSIVPDLGFELEDATKHYEPYSGGALSFNSWRKGNVNIIFTNDKGFFERFLNANALCQSLCLQSREDRVLVFQAVLYNSFPDALAAMRELSALTKGE